MPATHPQNNAEALCSTLAYLLESTSEKGYWTDPKEDWEPILACVAVEVLMDAGLTVDHRWVIKNGGYAQMSLEAPLRWLDGRIQPDGSFGTDFWEACRLAHAIEKHALHAYFPNYSVLKSKILEIHESNTILTSESDWVGPGFLSAAADYFDRIGMYRDGEAFVTRLLSMQESNGQWCGSVTKSGHPIVSPVWHTSQVVLTLKRKGATQYRDAINRAIAWIKETQDPCGKWPGIEQFVIYSTCYAILALDQAEVPDLVVINRGLDYLKTAMKPSGKFQDLGGTLMAAIALLAVVKHHVGSDLSTIDYVLARQAKGQAESAETRCKLARDEAATYKSRNEALERKYHNAEFGVTKKQLFIAGPIIAVGLAVLNSLANRAINGPWPMQPPAASQSRGTPQDSAAPPRSSATSHGSGAQPQSTGNSQRTPKGT